MVRSPNEKDGFKALLKENHPTLYQQIESEGGLDSLRVLEINAANYSALNGKLNFFGNIKSVILDEIPEAWKDLSILENIKKPNGVDSLKILKNHGLTSLSVIEKFTALKSLQVLSNLGLTSLTGIEKLTALKSLKISESPELTSLTGIEKLTALKILKIAGIQFLTSLSSIEFLTGLHSLSIEDNESLTSFYSLYVNTKQRF